VPSLGLPHKMGVSNFYIRDGTFFFASTFAMKLHSFDVTLSQPTRYFSPDVAEMQFVYRSWADYKKKHGLPVLLVDKVLPVIEKHNIKKAKKLIAISNIVKEEIMRIYGTPSEKIDVAHSGVNLDMFNPKSRRFSKEIRKKHGIKDDDIVLLFVGNPFGRKGLRYIIEALPKVKSNKVKLLVLGKDGINPFLELASKLGVKDKVVYGGFSSEVFKYFGASDIFVFPTLYEPFGLVILEAMASGLPPITSKIAGAAELIDDGKDGFQLKNPKNSNDIAEKINYLVNNDKLRKRMSVNTRKKAEKYSWKRTANLMMKTFEEAAEMKGIK